MKNYTITVNGNVYEVAVEEGNGAGVQKAAAAPVKASAPVAGGSVNITAPMPGKILKIAASAGKAVKKGEVILTFEAMKMENDIVAPQDGTVASVNCAVGDSVEAGAVVATLA